MLGAYVGGAKQCPSLCTWQGIVIGPSPNRDLAADGIVATVSHELMESATDGAIAKLQAANQRGPHWADPLKAWGDVLEKQGLPQEALAKYDEALKYAPS